VLLLGAGAFFALREDPRPGGPPASRDRGYVDSAVCVECHKEEARLWAGSDHDRAMERATPATVLGDFDGAEVTVHGVTSRFERRGERHFVLTEGEGGVRGEHEVLYTFGVRPLQQYLVELPRGRVQCLPLAWATEERRWFHLYEEPIRPDDPLYWTGPMQNWNFMCAECHSTRLDRGYDPEGDVYRTTWHEIDVGCQSCHGPGERHVRWARTGEPLGDDSVDAKGLWVRLSRVPPTTEVETCARCHSRRSVVEWDYEPGARYLDHYDLQLLTEPHYHADGQIHDEVYVYGSFLQTKKSKAGVRCTDCHDPHSAGLKAEGNALCVRCHSPTPDPRFPTLKAKTYDSPDHTHHLPGSPGSHCVDCHMPATTYMVVDPRRDHSFRVPRPDLTLSIGTPNACNGCHVREGPAWAAAAIERWFPRPATEPRPRHFAEAMTAARDGRPGAAAELAALVADKEVAGIVRATALARLEAFRGPEAWAAIAVGLRDEDGLVRAAAVRLLSARVPPNVPPEARVRKAIALAPLLLDPLRLVRTEAARAMAEAGVDAVPADAREAHARALAEFERRQQQVLDRPDGWFNLAVLRENQGRAEEAERLYGRALERDKRFIPALANRAILRSTLGRLDEAEADLRAALAVSDADGRIWYSLGLLLAEKRELEAAADALLRAVGLLPWHARVRLNLGLVERELGRTAEALAAFEDASRIAPEDPDPVFALVDLLVAEGRLDEAERRAEALASRLPAARELLERVRAARAR
jgi:predicted CXXCH cytochrome family protein